MGVRACMGVCVPIVGREFGMFGTHRGYLLCAATSYAHEVNLGSGNAITFKWSIVGNEIHARVSGPNTGEDRVLDPSVGYKSVMDVLIRRFHNLSQLRLVPFRLLRGGIQYQEQYGRH